MGYLLTGGLPAKMTRSYKILYKIAKLVTKFHLGSRKKTCSVSIRRSKRFGIKALHGRSQQQYTGWGPPLHPGTARLRGRTSSRWLLSPFLIYSNEICWKKAWWNWHDQWHATGTPNPSEVIAKSENEWSHFMAYCGIPQYILWLSTPFIPEVTCKLAQILN